LVTSYSGITLFYCGREWELALPGKITTIVHRDLVKRLVLATAAISLIIVTIAYFLERSRIIDDITFFARQRVAQINPALYDLLDDPSRLDSVALLERIKGKHGPVQQRTGYFPAIAVYDLQGLKIADRLDPAYPHGSDLLKGLAETLPVGMLTDGPMVTPTRIGGRPVVRIGLPLSDRHGRMVLQIQGIYALSQVALDEFNQRLRRTLLFILLIVAATSLVLYPVVLGLLRRVEGLSLRLLDANLAVIQTLGSAIAKRDSDTDAHNYRVTLYAVRLAEAVGLDATSMQGLIKGAFLHDVGKIGTEDRILLKPGRLDEEEFSVMRRHVGHGVDIVGRSVWLGDAIPIVSCHHEKFDGTGYPKALRGEEIPAGARIFAIADVFDALTSARPYKQALPLAAALEILIEGRGRHFDPEYLDRFFEMAPELYSRFAGDESENVREELGAIVRVYFPREDSPGH
jgi:HD-GYP domain-containing protein (c-di-GMP phosphodiesterase class II)